MHLFTDAVYVGLSHHISKITSKGLHIVDQWLHMVLEILSTKPLPKPVLIYHQPGPLAFIQNFDLNNQDINPQVVLEIYTFETTAISPRGWWVGDKPLPEPMLYYCQLDT